MKIPNHPDSLQRVVIENVTPQVNGGRYPVKRVPGERVVVEADIFCDGHNELCALLQWRAPHTMVWNETPMELLGNDHWRVEFRVEKLGRYTYSVVAWLDQFRTWRRDLRKRIDAGQDVTVDLQIGAEIIENTLAGIESSIKTERRIRDLAAKLTGWAKELLSGTDMDRRVEIAFDETLAAAMDDCCRRGDIAALPQDLMVEVNPPLARSSTWYEMFPRSASPTPDRPGTFDDVIARLDYVAGLGFDVLYLPPIHPIGSTHRKGRNNTTECQPDDPGSPWGIGSALGGFDAVNPDLGTLDDFKRLLKEARKRGLEVALDIAFQCSPDHPWINDHPEWFRRRPDGSIQYAENPPKKYQDIYPLEFDNPDWEGLWTALKDVFAWWVEQGVTLFRVDNPHTKPFAFWEWCLAEIKHDHPEVIFLSEAFTRPRTMFKLAKLGFTQSYTYFPWRTEKWELEQYFTELAQPLVREFFHGSHWTNSPDILIEYLQRGGKPAFAVRFLLAATLGANYGMYGPPFELCVNRPLKPGSEEYWESEKYEVKYWDLERMPGIQDLIRKVNGIRREHPALKQDWNIVFHPIDNERIICYSKHTDDLSDLLLMFVNLDPANTQGGNTQLKMDRLGLADDAAFEVRDLLTGETYPWRGVRNFVMLDPGKQPGHILQILKPAT